MAVNVKNLVAAKQVENAQTVQYTATNCVAVIDKATVTNTSGANAVLSVNIIASGGVAGDSNLIIKQRSIAPNECYTCPELVGQCVYLGSTISTLAGTASALTLAISGREITS